MVIGTNDVQKYNKSENRQKKDLKALKKQNKMIYIMANKSSLRHEIKNIKNISTKTSNKTSVSSSDDSDSDLLLARNSS